MLQLSPLKMKMVSYSIYIANMYTDLQFVVSRLYNHDIYLLYSGITIGFFCPATYYVNEDAGNVSVIVETLRGTPARDVMVNLQTEDGSAIGKAVTQIVSLSECCATQL